MVLRLPCFPAWYIQYLSEKSSQTKSVSLVQLCAQYYIVSQGPFRRRTRTGHLDE